MYYICSTVINQLTLTITIMKIIDFSNEALMEAVNEHFDLICNENMEIEVTDDEAQEIAVWIKANCPAAVLDYCIYED